MGLEDPDRQQENYPNEGCPAGQRWNWQLQRCMDPTVQPGYQGGGGNGGGGGGGGGGDCPPGQAMSRGGHPGNPMRCRPVADSGGGGGAPVGGGGARPAGPVAVGSVGPAEGDIASTIWGHINGALNGKLGWDDATVARMKGQVFQAAMGRRDAGMQSVNDDLVSRGLARTGIASQAQRQLLGEANRDYTAGVTNIHIERENKRIELKLRALDMAQKHLDSLRDYLVSRESNANQREIGLAQIKLGYAKIASEKELLTMQLAARGGGGGGGGFDPFAAFMQLANQG